MKQRKIYLLVVLGLILAGCSKETEIIETVQEEVIEEMEPVDLYISDNMYDDIWVINDNYFLIYNGSKYGVIDKAENIVIESMYDFGNILFNQNILILGNYIEGGYDCFLYDEQMNMIYSNDEYKEYIIASINEGIIQLVDYSMTKYIYLDMNDKYKKVIELSEDNIPGFMAATPYVMGNVLIVSDTYNENGFPNLISKDGNIRYLSYNGNMIYTYFGCAISEDGWILCYEIDIDDVNNIQKGFYNINKDIFSPIPEDYPIVNASKGNDGIYHAVNGGYALLQKSIDDSVSYIFDVENMKIISDEPYDYVDISNIKNKLILYREKNEGRWGYLYQDLTKTDMLYKDATSFSKLGYALINDGKNEYVINTNGQIVSEPIEGYEATQEGKFFIITKGEGKYFIEIK